MLVHKDLRSLPAGISRSWGDSCTQGCESTESASGILLQKPENLTTREANPHSEHHIAYAGVEFPGTTLPSADDVADALGKDIHQGTQKTHTYGVSTLVYASLLLHRDSPEV